MVVNAFVVPPLRPLISNQPTLVKHFSSSSPSTDSMDNEIVQRISEEWKELISCASLMFQYGNQKTVKATDIVEFCDDMDAQVPPTSTTTTWLSQTLRPEAYKFARYQLLTKLMIQDYEAYVATATFLSPSRIPRVDLPNVQEVPFTTQTKEEEEKEEKEVSKKKKVIVDDKTGMTLVQDCELEDMVYKESVLDQILLSIFRKLVVKYTDGVGVSDKPGIEGLLEQGRKYMLKPDQTPQAQHTMVKNTLGGLMTPVLPPFYRIFMTGIVPSNFDWIPESWRGKQIGPWFYAPYLTSIVTPTFFGFLVGPSYPNRRIDGQRGGLVVEKCKFLQQSGCKGLCLHQCKLPAQEFFSDTLGLDLTVKPNFETQECQWSFGEVRHEHNIYIYIPI